MPSTIGPLPLPSGPTVQDLLALKRTRLGLLTNRRCLPALLGSMAARLQLLAMRPRTAASTEEAAAAYGCQWWGLRVVATKVTACWGGADNLAWLTEQAERPRPPIASPEFGWWSLGTSAAAAALWTCRRIAERDVTQPQPGTPAPAAASETFRRWMRVFGLNPSSALLTALSVPETEALLMHMLQQMDGPARWRFALLLDNRKTLPGRMEVLTHLGQGDDQAARLARMALVSSGTQTPPMAAAVFRDIVDALYSDGFRWRPQTLSYLTGASVPTVQLWYWGRAPVPDTVAAWLWDQWNLWRCRTYS